VFPQSCVVQGHRAPKNPRISSILAPALGISDALRRMQCRLKGASCRRIEAVCKAKDWGVGAVGINCGRGARWIPSLQLSRYEHAEK
jgi:hypothetical protein